MSKLSFLKLDIEIMNDSKIKMIRKMPAGPQLFELWIGLMCLAMKSGRPGCVEIGDGIPFTDEMLSDELDIPISAIQLGLATFQRFKMVEFFEDQTIFLTNFEKHQELTRIEEKKVKERERKRAYRQKLKALPCPTGQDGDRTSCPATDIDKDIDVDKEVDTEIKKKIKKKPPKHKYGEYKHVLLTDEEYEGLKTKVDDREKWIRKLDEGIENKGYKYNNHSLTIQNWHRGDKKKGDAPINPTYDYIHPEVLAFHDKGKTHE